MIHATMIISILSLLATMGGETTTRGRPTKRSSIRIRMNLKIHGSSCYAILYIYILYFYPSFFSQKVIDDLSFPFSSFLSFFPSEQVISPLDRGTRGSSFIELRNVEFDGSWRSMQLSIYYLRSWRVDR